MSRVRKKVNGVQILESRFWKVLILLLKVAVQILGRNFYENTKKSSFYSQSLLIFIHRAPVVERHPITREIKDLLWPMSTPTRNTVYFYMSSSFIYTLKIHRRSFNQAFDEDIMENKYMFVMLWNLSVSSHWIFPQYCFLFLAPDLKVT